MKVTFDRQDLTRALKLVKRTTAKNHEVLSNVHISAGDGITLRTTDLDCGLSVGVQGDGEGEVVLPAAELTALVEKSPTDEIHLECEHLQATITMGRAEYQLNAFADDFPEVPARDGDAIELPAAELTEALERTVFAAGEDDAMPILGGVHLSGGDGVLSVTATDGFRIATYTMDCGAGVGCVIPAASVKNILAMLREYPASHVYLYPGDHLHVESDAAVCHAVPLAGEYPNVMNMISLDGAFRNKVDKQDLANTIERASVLAEESRGKKFIKLRVGDGAIRVTSECAEMGRADDKVAAETGGELDVRVNARYLLDALKHSKSDTADISFTPDLNPLFLIDGQWSCYVLPMKPRGARGRGE